MKKILLVMSVAILIALCSVPSYVSAANVGQAIVEYNGKQFLIDLICSQNPEYLYNSGSHEFIYGYVVYNNRDIIFHENLSGGMYDTALTPWELVVGYIPTLSQDYVYDVDYGSGTHRLNHIYNTYEEFYEDLPSQFKPSLSLQRWNDFYEWFKDKFGYYPSDTSLIGVLRYLLTLGEDDSDVPIEFIPPSPTPTPTPTPTPIPVQTIFVPDGNGNTTIIYQYPDPTTGVITQSPYNPNIQNNITVDCNCDSDNVNDLFGTDPSDPYALTSSMLWQDGFGVQISDNPLTVANQSQQTLAEAASEYSDSVNVLSNSFNVLPYKWLALAGLLGGILIIAGLIRTFLGG